MTSFGLKVFQTAFAGKAHATERRCVDTVLPIGFDCLICRSQCRLGLDPTKAVESSALLGFQPNLPERSTENVFRRPF